MKPIYNFVIRVWRNYRSVLLYAQIGYTTVVVGFKSYIVAG